VFGIVVDVVVVVYKKLFYKKYSWGWFEKIYVLVKTVVEIEVE